MPFKKGIELICMCIYMSFSALFLSLLTQKVFLTHVLKATFVSLLIDISDILEVRIRSLDSLKQSLLCAWLGHREGMPIKLSFSHDFSQIRTVFSATVKIWHFRIKIFFLTFQY